MWDKRLRRVYLNYNRRYFSDKLPKDAEIVWESLTGSLLGYQQGDKIALNVKTRYADVIWRGTLLHEMVHLELPAKVKHGPRFRKRMRELVAQGAFDGLI